MEQVTVDEKLRRKRLSIRPEPAPDWFCTETHPLHATTEDQWVRFYRAVVLEQWF